LKTKNGNKKVVLEAALKTVAKSLPPNELIAFAALLPAAAWDPDFRDYAVPPNVAGHDYKRIKQRLIADQGSLCAYCERSLADLGPNLQRVEHYHPKSDNSVPGINWGLLWTNVIAVCTGGENDDRQRHPLPTNLSCDSHKNHWLGKLNPTPAALLALLADLQSPLSLAPFPCPFGFDRLTGKLNVDETICSAIDAVLGLAAGSTYTSLNATINTALNLNCDRLCTDRLQVLIQYNQELVKARNAGDRHYGRKLAAKWFGRKWPSYFTTRRILLGQAAEAHLQTLAYQG